VEPRPDGAMVGLAATHLESSRLAGDGTVKVGAGSRNAAARVLTADELLANGPRGGPRSPQGKRHRKILLNQSQILAAAAVVEEAPHRLHTTLASEEYKDTSTGCRSQAQGRLAAVVLDRLRRVFLEASLAHSRSDLREERLPRLHKEVGWARGLADHCGPTANGEFQKFELDAEALQALSVAKALQQEALQYVGADEEPELMEARARLVGDAMAMLKKWTKHSEIAHAINAALLTMLEVKKKDLLITTMKVTNIDLNRLSQSPDLLVKFYDAVKSAIATECGLGVKSEDLEVELSLTSGFEGVKATLTPPSGISAGMLRTKLCSASAALDQTIEGKIAQVVGIREVSSGHVGVIEITVSEEPPGDPFREEMDRRGLGVLVSTVADIWARRPEVCRRALYLLSMVSIELIILHIQEQVAVGGDGLRIVGLGLEVLNRRARDDPRAIDDIKLYGGMEMLDIVEPQVESDRMVSLQALNLRRRLKRSKVKSLRGKRTVNVPPEDVVRLRGCFECIDEDESGFIDVEELAIAFQMLGIKQNSSELAQAVLEVDVDGSGKIEWPEFLWLMSRFGEKQSIEQQFTEERLAELREVFSLFDDDGNGQLDARELSMVMRSVGLCPTEHEIHAMINEVDADSSGCIEWPEFLYLMSRKVVHPENQHRLAFEFFDKENEGKLDKTTFIETMQSLSTDLTVEDLEEMILECKFEEPDMEVITYKEFVKMMMRP